MGDGKKLVPGCISDAVSFKMLILVWKLVGRCRFATSWCDLDMMFDLAEVTLTFPGYTRKCVGHSFLVGTLVGGCRCAMSWCGLDLTFDLL